MKAGLFIRNILLSYLVLSPILLSGIEYYLISAILSTFIIGLLEVKRVEKVASEIAEFTASIKRRDLRKRIFLKEKGTLGELAKNIQELKIQLEQSEEDKHKIKEILRNMSDGLMLMDTKGRIMLCNSATKKFFGTEEDIEGKTLVETLRNAELLDVLKKAIDKGETITHEIAIAHPKEIYLIATAVPFYFPPEGKNLSGIVLSLHDITRLKHLENMRKDFIANVSHEIKTPITAIKGFADTLLDGAIDDRENARRFLETIKNHSERLNSLVSDLLTLSSIELGDVRMEKLNVDIVTVTDAVFTTLSNKARAKGLYLKKSFPAEPLEIYADKDRLMQILLNLVDNGIKFTESGGVTVSVRVKSEKLKVERTLNSQLQNFVEILVEDTGIGIPKWHLPRLGERFYRVDRSRSRELGGTGLGLAIVKHLVKAHGWEMEIESTQGKGTKVKILVS